MCFREFSYLRESEYVPRLQSEKRETGQTVIGAVSGRGPTVPCSVNRAALVMMPKVGLSRRPSLKHLIAPAMVFFGPFSCPSRLANLVPPSSTQWNRTLERTAVIAKRREFGSRSLWPTRQDQPSFALFLLPGTSDTRFMYTDARRLWARFVAFPRTLSRLP